MNSVASAYTLIYNILSFSKHRAVLNEKIPDFICSCGQRDCFANSKDELPVFFFQKASCIFNIRSPILVKKERVSVEIHSYSLFKV